MQFCFTPKLLIVALRLSLAFFVNRKRGLGGWEGMYDTVRQVAAQCSRQLRRVLWRLIYGIIPRLHYNQTVCRESVGIAVQCSVFGSSIDVSS